LNGNRAKKLASYIVKGQDSRDAFLPTSLLLATDKWVRFNEQDNTVEFNPAVVGPFSVVDGQHRLEGLKQAARRDARVLDFEVPVNIAVDLPKIAQMCHFLIVNTTQTAVDKSVEQRIIARLSDALDLEDLPSLPKWHPLRGYGRAHVDSIWQTAKIDNAHSKAMLGFGVHPLEWTAGGPRIG
jgi:DGQHR domain-containing protein